MRAFKRLASLERNYSTKIFVSNSHDPFENLSTELFFFQKHQHHQTLFLYRNSPTVVIGKYQNPWKECKVNLMEEDGIHLVRRQSGGGAVYQDLGNSIFSFLSRKDQYSKERNFEIVLNALKDLDIQGTLSGRNDITTVDGLKFSGSAYKEIKDQALHHGTLLLDVDSTILENYLTPHKLKLQAKGVDSVKSRITNLIKINSQITHENVCDSLIHHFQNVYKSNIKPESFSPKEAFSSNPDWKSIYNAMLDFDFRFGKTPQFSYSFEKRYEGWGFFDIHIDVKLGVIRDVEVFSDTLFPYIVEGFKENLKGKPMLKDSFLQLGENLIKNIPRDITEDTRVAMAQCIEQLALDLSQNL